MANDKDTTARAVIDPDTTSRFVAGINKLASELGLSRDDLATLLLSSGCVALADLRGEQAAARELYASAIQLARSAGIGDDMPAPPSSTRH